MPDSGEYQNGWNLKIGQNFGDYSITQLNIGHHQLVRWNEYEYPTTVVLQWRGSNQPSVDLINSAFEQFSVYTDGTKIIRSQSGRPYQCYFHYPLDQSLTGECTPDFLTLTVKATGYCKRVSEAVAKQI